MKEILSDIQTGKFAAQWQAEFRNGEVNYRSMLEKELQHPIEKVGKDIRRHFSWLSEKAMDGSSCSNKTNSPSLEAVTK